MRRTEPGEEEQDDKDDGDQADAASQQACRDYGPPR